MQRSTFPIRRLARTALVLVLLTLPAPVPAAAETFLCSGSSELLAATTSQSARPPSSSGGPAVRSSRAPDDPWFERQPEIFSGCWSFDLRTVWDVTHGTSAAGAPVVVAVVDSGLDAAQPDLEGALWTNPGETPGNDLDDDGNGYVDDVHGADVLAHDTPLGDRYGHGTQVSGLIAARGDNGIGITGTAWDARIMPVRVINDQGTGTSAQLAEGIRYAADNGAKVINVSLNTSLDTAALREAITHARERDALVVASAGNDGRNLDVARSYPAASDDPAVLSVAATGFRGTLASFSNHGRQTVDVASTGVDLPTTLTGSRFGLFSGTSASAAVVSGVAALLRAAAPQASAPQIREALMKTALEQGRYDVASGVVAPGAALHTLTSGTSSASGAGAAAVPGPGSFVEMQGRVDRAAASRQLTLELRARHRSAAEPTRCRFTLRPRTSHGAAGRTLVRTAPVRFDAARLSVTLARDASGVSVRAQLITATGRIVAGGTSLVR